MSKKEEHRHVNLSNARDEAGYRSVIEQIAKDGVCPFCPEYLTRYHKKPILHETDGWLVTENQWPYQGTKHHFFLILKRHATVITELTEREWGEVQVIINMLSSKYLVQSGAFLLRFGSTESSGATVEHLHAHLITTDVTSDDYEPVRVRVG